MAARSVFIVGPGFIGWNVLELLVSEGYKVTGLVRRKEHAQAIEKSGATAVMGDLNDKKLIADETAKVDIVFHTATADHLESAQAVLDGVKARASQGKSTIYIHTSGTSVLDDGSKGEFKNDKIYYDNKPEEVDGLPDSAPHRQIDLAIVKVQRELGEKAKIAIMIPPEIYGYNPNHDRLTIQIPTITRFALKHGWAGYVGKGVSVESQIHVLDLARAYIVLLHAMEANQPTFTLQNPYFYCENGEEFSWLEVAEHVAQALYRCGRIQDPKPRTFAKTDYVDLFGDFTDPVIGLNSRSRAVRLRELGWSPREKDIWQSFEQDELPAILRDWDATADQERGGYKGTVAS